MDALSNEEKFYKILHLLLKFETQLDNIYVDKIFDHLQRDENSTHLKIEPITNWAQQLIYECENGQIPESSVFAFALRLINLMCRNEVDFLIIQKKQILEKFAILIRKHLDLQTINIKVNHIRLLQQLITYKNGFEWLMKWQIWRFCLYFTDSTYNQQLLRERAELIVSILIKLEDMRQYDTCFQILDVVLEPLCNHIWYSGNAADISTILDDPKIEPVMLHFHIFMEHYFLCTLKHRRKLVSNYYILIKKQFQNTGWKSRDVSFGILYTQQLLRTQTVADFVRLICMQIPPEDKVAQPLKFEKFTINFYNTIYFCTERMNPRSALFLASYITRRWSTVNDLQIDESMDHSKLKFLDQVLMIQLCPILFVIKERAQTNNTEYLDQFCMKLFYMSCEHTTRHLYAVAEVLRFSGKNNIDLACESIRGIVEPQVKLTIERATLVFQALLYVLIEFLPVSEIPSTVSTIVEKHPKLLSTLLSGLFLLIKNYQISWNNCIEATSLINISKALLANPLISGRLAVQVFNLIQLSIKHRIGTANLALLVDSLEGSGLENLGPTIIQRLSNDDIEVRDAAIELTIEIVRTSKAKFPAFQKLLFDNEILAAIVNMSTKDDDGYVRSLAFKCITEALSIQAFHGQLLEAMRIKDLMSTLVIEDESMVRREAVIAFTEWFASLGITEEAADLCFSTMAFIATNDSDFETRVNGLEFWKIVLEQNFIMQGWTDQGFPSMIFIQKKIIKLNPNEIQSRLKNIVQDYAYYGGCGVLLTCCNDDSLVVAEKAVEIVDILLSRLHKYNYLKTTFQSHQSAQNSSELENVSVNVSRKASFVSQQQYKPVDDEMENVKSDVSVDTPKEFNDEKVFGIIGESDYNLLAGTLEKMQLDDEQTDETEQTIDTKLYEKYAKITESIFLDVLSQMNLSAIIKSRRDWISSPESFSSILTDLIYSFTRRDCNDVDCC